MSPPANTQRVAIPLTIAVALVTTAIAYFGTRDVPAPLASLPTPTVTAATVQGSVRSIVLPVTEIELPPGPHQREFIGACTTCHSARLVLNQPAFPRAKWGEIVKKMVKVYGAPIAAEQEPPLLEYLAAIRGE
jgi:hypothetical protein